MSGLVKNIISLFKQRYPLYVAYDSGGKNKTPIVLLHGIAATHKYLQAIIDRIDSKKYRIIAIDMLGFGQSPKPQDCDYDIKDHVRSVRMTLNNHGITKPFILLGHSMGAIIATDYTKTYPLDVSQLFLLSIPIYQKTDKVRQSRTTKARIDLFLKAYHYLLDRKDMAMKYSKSIRNILKLPDGIDINEDNWFGFQKSLLNTVIKQKVIENINNIYVPISIFYGSLDALLIKKNIKLLNKINNVSITKINGAHHLVSAKFASVVAKEINKL